MVSKSGRLRIVGIGGTLRGSSSSLGALRRALRAADALILSTAAYHGTLAGVTKNALDFTQFLARDERPYLDGAEGLNPETRSVEPVGVAV